MKRRVARIEIACGGFMVSFHREDLGRASSTRDFRKGLPGGWLAYTGSMKLRLFIVVLLGVGLMASTKAQTPARSGEMSVLLVPDRVFDGVAMHTSWQVLVTGDR